MESELPGIIRVKVVAKNILLGSLRTQHQAVLAMFFFEETYKFSVFKLLHLSVSLIYVKEKSFCLFN